MIWTIWGPFIVPVNRGSEESEEDIYISSLFKDTTAIHYSKTGSTPR